jgi:hypothetical protein
MVDTYDRRCRWKRSVLRWVAGVGRARSNPCLVAFLNVALMLLCSVAALPAVLADAVCCGCRAASSPRAGENGERLRAASSSALEASERSVRFSCPTWTERVSGQRVLSLLSVLGLARVGAVPHSSHPFSSMRRSGWTMGALVLLMGRLVHAYSEDHRPTHAPGHELSFATLWPGLSEKGLITARLRKEDPNDAHAGPRAFGRMTARSPRLNFHLAITGERGIQGVVNTYANCADF